MATCRYRSKIGSLARWSLAACVLLPLLIEGIPITEDSKLPKEEAQVPGILKADDSISTTLGPTSEASQAVTLGPSSEARGEVTEALGSTSEATRTVTLGPSSEATETMTEPLGSTSEATRAVTLGPSSQATPVGTKPTSEAAPVETMGPTSEATRVVTQKPSSGATRRVTSKGPTGKPGKSTTAHGQNSTKAALMTQSTTSKSRVGLIAGIAIVVILVLCVAVYCVFCRGEKPKEQPPSGQGGKLKSKMDTTSLKMNSTKMQPSSLGTKSFKPEDIKSNAKSMASLEKAKSSAGAKEPVPVNPSPNVPPPNVPLPPSLEQMKKGSAESFKSCKTKKSESSGGVSGVTESSVISKASNPMKTSAYKKPSTVASKSSDPKLAALKGKAKAKAKAKSKNKSTK